MSSSSAAVKSTESVNGHRRAAAALFVPSSPTQRNRAKVRNGSIGNGHYSHTSASAFATATATATHTNAPTSPTTTNGQQHRSHSSARSSLFAGFRIQRTKSSHSSSSSLSSSYRKSPWSVTAWTNLVICFLILLISLTLVVNVFQPSLFLQQTDSILEPPEPPEFQQMQQERLEEEQQDKDEGNGGAVVDALLPHDLGIVVAPHLGPLPQRNRQRQNRQRGAGRRHSPHNLQDQKNQEHPQLNGRRRRQARFRGQLPDSPSFQLQQQQHSFEDEQQNQHLRTMRMMMMMMRFQAVEIHDNQLLKRNKFGQVVFRPVTNVSQGDLELDDRFLPDEVDESVEEQEARAQRKELLDILNDAGVKSLDLATIKSLPTTEQLLQLYGPGPVIFGEDTCATFQQQVPAWDASMGPAGLFNTGTNPLAMYLEANCMIESNRQRNRGMRWQVPWGKHMLASRKWTNTAQNDYTVNKKHVLPVVMIRDPYMWMQSLCKHPYATKWYRSKAHCPSLVPTMYDRFLFPWIRADSLVVRVWKGTKWPSLAHLWTDWYQQYYRADYPRLIVRFEDMIYHPRDTIERICKCAGGVLRSEKEGTPFTYVVDSGKWGPAHGGKRTNLVSAMIKYGTDKKRFYNLTQADLQLAYEALDPEMMQIFQYAVSAPPSS